MYRYHCLNPISENGLKQLPDSYKKVDSLEEADAVLVRSAKMHDLEVPESLCAVARAGAGVNNIPVKEYAEKVGLKATFHQIEGYAHEWRFWDLCLQDALERFAPSAGKVPVFNQYRKV